jgi:hypothetical protein
MREWVFNCREHASLPKLAWLAEVETGANAVTVHHGSAVETASRWCVEGTWDGPFEAGDFHRAENLFGSGVRLDGQTLVFCSSVALVDRLFHVAWDDRLVISNSLIQLLARTGARLDPRHNYRRESFASGSGIKHYPSAFRVIHPRFHAVQQEYHSNLTLHDGRIERLPRSQPRSFANFGEYHEALVTALARIRDNYRSSARRHPVAAYATTSTGYDSAAATVLARAAGVTETFTIAMPPGAEAQEHDSGAPIAEALGMTVHGLSSEAEGASSEMERYLLAASVEGSEVFLENMARHIAANCQAAVLYTGYHGDVVWKLPARAPEVVDDMRRKDVSGLNLAEVRLAAGFFNLAVPFIYGRNMADITAISLSPEMQPWSVAADYDRPIPRRIVEAAGVPRQLFGQRKRAQVRFYGDPRSPVLRAQFREYLATRVAELSWRLTAMERLRSADHAVSFLVRRMLRLRDTPSLVRMVLPDHFDRRSLVFVWAVDGLAERFAGVYAAR